MKRVLTNSEKEIKEQFVVTSSIQAIDFQGLGNVVIMKCEAREAPLLEVGPR